MPYTWTDYEDEYNYQEPDEDAVEDFEDDFVDYEDDYDYDYKKERPDGLELQFEKLVGECALFYGASNNQFKLNGVVFEVVEDPDDGYRSYLDCVMIPKQEQKQEHFFAKPLAAVKIIKVSNGTEMMKAGNCGFSARTKEEIATDASYGEFSDICFFMLQDIDSAHVWLYFGTNHTCDYYPYFVFRYNPKTKETEFVDEAREEGKNPILVKAIFYKKEEEDE